MVQHTLAEVDEGGQCLQPHLGVVHPNQEPSESQTVLRARGHALLVLHLQLQQMSKHPHYNPVYTTLDRLYILLFLHFAVPIQLVYFPFLKFFQDSFPTRTRGETKKADEEDLCSRFGLEDE